MTFRYEAVTFFTNGLWNGFSKTFSGHIETATNILNELQYQIVWSYPWAMTLQQRLSFSWVESQTYRTVPSYFILFLGASPINAIQVHNLGVVAKNSLLENGGKILIIVQERRAHFMWGRDRRIWRTHDVISSIRTLKSNVDHKIALFSMCISWHVFNIVSLWLHHIYMWPQKSRIHASCFYTYF